MSYLYETHCHSSQCSRCAHSTAAELVAAYHRAGYAGLVLTDHFVLGNTAVNSSLPWETQMGAYYGAYLQAKEAAAELDMDVFFGIEHACDGREFLCYGIDLEFLLQNPQIPALSAAGFSALVRNAGGIVIQAHPFRYAPADTPVQWEILDGIEVYNAANSDAANAAAQAAARPDKLVTSGGDIHRADDSRIGQAGIWLPYRPRDSHQFAQALRQNLHRLK